MTQHNFGTNRFISTSLKPRTEAVAPALGFLLPSAKVQKEFFQEYARKNNCHLVRLYADEGISGTKIKKRKEFQRMMADAERGLFDMVVVKDISRFARNTVDLLESVCRLKTLGIEVQFLTANMTNMHP